MKSSNYILFTIVSLAVFSLTGCGQRQDIEAVKKALVEFDPSFKETLVKKSQIDTQIDSLKSDFRNKQSEINSKIMELEEELKAIRRANYAQIHELAAQLDPERQKASLKLGELSTILKNKENLLGTFKNSLKETKKIVESQKSGLPQEEKAKWQKNMDDLNLQIPTIEEEISKLKREIGFYRQESSILKY